MLPKLLDKIPEEGLRSKPHKTLRVKWLLAHDTHWTSRSDRQMLSNFAGRQNVIWTRGKSDSDSVQFSVTDG